MREAPPSFAPGVRTVAETRSTNDDMKVLARDGAPEGYWLRAERQTSGKGRMGRAWESEAGNLFASTLVRLSPGDPAPATLALVAAVAVHEAIEDLAGRGRVAIKWPNDIMAGNAKLCGMLLERVEDAIIIGIGVNVASAPAIAGRETTSLYALGIEACDAASVLDLISRRLADQLYRWRTYGIEPTIRAWESRAHARGATLRAQLPDGEQLEGAFEGLDRDGALILRLADGARHVIHAADIFAL